MLGSARMAVGQPTRINDSMLRNLPQQKALLWNFYTMLVPLPFGYCEWEIFSSYSLRFFFLPVICFCNSFLRDMAHYFALCDQRLGPPVVCVTLLLGFFSPL